MGCVKRDVLLVGSSKTGVPSGVSTSTTSYGSMELLTRQTENLKNRQASDVRDD
jgi:hypothetical protein